MIDWLVNVDDFLLDRVAQPLVDGAERFGLTLIDLGLTGLALAMTLELVRFQLGEVDLTLIVIGSCVNLFFAILVNRSRHRLLSVRAMNPWRYEQRALRWSGLFVIMITVIPPTTALTIAQALATTATFYVLACQRPPPALPWGACPI